MCCKPAYINIFLYNLTYNGIVTHLQVCLRARRPIRSFYAKDNHQRTEKYHRLTQDELAAKLQVNGYNFSKLTILRIELGKRLVTDIELKGLCEFFETDPNSILDYDLQSGQKTASASKESLNRRF